MKTPILFIVMILIVWSCKAQTASSCTPSVLLSHTYGPDAADLALERIFQLQAADTSTIEVPAIYQDTILQGLAAICNLDTLLQADSVFRSYCIHANPYGFVKYKVSVNIDTSFAWARQWTTLNSVTGNTPLDDFMSSHGFTVTNYYAYLYDLVTITTTHTLNYKAFADSLALFPGVLSISTFGTDPVGDGDHIYYTKDSVRTYVFDLGWGDCSSGCNNRKRWTYKVDDACNVTLLSVTQNILSPGPAPLQNCNLFPLSLPAEKKGAVITSYPNPTNGLLHISLSLNTQCEYLIMDIYGRTMRQGTMIGNTVVSLKDLCSGIYLLKINTADGEYYHERIIKD